MRRIPDDNLAYPVLVKAGNSSGSGFFLNADNGIFLVTASHVLYDQKSFSPHSPQVEITSYPKAELGHEKNVFLLDLVATERAGEIQSDFVRDITVLRIGARDTQIGHLCIPPALNIVEISSEGLTGIGIEGVKMYCDVLIANDVFIFGYPVSLGLPNIPQIDYSRPLLRSGIVAGKNDSITSIVLDCPAYPGNSGGPVLEVEQDEFQYKYRVIGVVTQFVPTVAEVFGVPVAGAVVNSGYSLAAAMDGVIYLTKKFPELTFFSPANAL
jgi:Trypsin-like peptidase domain